MQSEDAIQVVQHAMVEEFERRKKMRSIAVPTDDGQVRARLRDLNQPITVFGEQVRQHL
jgi:U4/U6 small nuclear ribonucleoprotein PRP4